VAVRQAALVSDESALEACLRRCAIQIDDLYHLPLPSYEVLRSRKKTDEFMVPNHYAGYQL